MNNKLNDAILEAYEAYATAKDYVKGWQKEASRRRSVVLTIINAAKKADPEIREVSTKELFNRTAEMWEADHAPVTPTAPDQEEADQPQEVQEDQPQEVQEDQTQEVQEMEAPADQG